MSKVFSIIGLETDTGIRDVGFMSGIPEVEDIQKSQLYRELVEDCGKADYIKVAVKSFRYGEGEMEDATAQDLDWLRSHPEFLKSDAITHLQTLSFAVLHPDHGMNI